MFSLELFNNVAFVYILLYICFLEFLWRATRIINLIKGYLRYKIITSQNVPSDSQIEIFFIRKKVVFRSQDTQFLVFLTIPWFTKFMVSSSILLHEDWCIFKYIFWTTTQVTKFGRLIDINKDNDFQKSFEQFGGVGLVSRSFSF